MNSQTLANSVDLIVKKAQSRILGVGSEQYSITPEIQKFEIMSIQELVDYTEEEALDLINYGVMLSHRIMSLKEAIVVLERRFEERAASPDY